MIALLVEVGIIGSLDLAVSLRRNDDPGAAGDDPVREMIRVITLVGDGRSSGDAVDQVMSKSDVVALTGRADQTDRKTEGFRGGVDFGAQAAAGPAQTLGIRPPLTLRAPAAC